ncbi:MAG: RDD family protein, partial [Flavisolibacter sp.]
GTASLIINLIISWLYYAIQESGASQATFGKKSVGIKVTNIEGQPITFGQATGRYFGKIISLLTLFIGYLMMLWDEKKQTLHDKMASTLVVKS